MPKIVHRFRPDSDECERIGRNIRAKLVLAGVTYKDIAVLSRSSVSAVQRVVFNDLFTERIRDEICRVTGCTEAELWPEPEKRQAAA